MTIPVATTYSFVSIVGSIIGPGGNVPLGDGAAVAEEGITIEPTSDKNTATYGADGGVQHALHAAAPGHAIVRLLKTSPTNAVLSQMFNTQRLNPGSWGQNVLQWRDVYRGDVCTLTSAAFKRHAPVTYDVDGKFNEWEFEGPISQILGAGVPNVNTASGF